MSGINCTLYPRITPFRPTSDTCPHVSLTDVAPVTKGVRPVGAKDGAETKRLRF